MKPPPVPPARLDVDELRRREASSTRPPAAEAVRLFVWNLLVFAFGMAVGAALVGLGR